MSAIGDRNYVIVETVSADRALLSGDVALPSAGLEAVSVDLDWVVAFNAWRSAFVALASAVAEEAVGGRERSPLSSQGRSRASKRYS